MNSLALGLDSGPRRLPDPMIRTKGNYSEKTIDTAGLLIEVLPGEPRSSVFAPVTGVSISGDSASNRKPSIWFSRRLPREL